MRNKYKNKFQWIFLSGILMWIGSNYEKICKMYLTRFEKRTTSIYVSKL